MNIPALVRKFLRRILINAANTHGVMHDNATVIIRIMNGEPQIFFYDGHEQKEHLSEEAVQRYATKEVDGET